MLFAMFLLSIRAGVKSVFRFALSPRAWGGRAFERGLNSRVASVRRCGLRNFGAFRKLATAVLGTASVQASWRTVAPKIRAVSSAAPNQSFNRTFCPGLGLGIISFLPKPKPGQNAG